MRLIDKRLQHSPNDEPQIPAFLGKLRTKQTDLPALPKNAASMAGPTPWCNWVVRGQVLAGAYPASTDDRETERILTTLLEHGMEVFVCLQAEVSLNIPETMWRAGRGLR